MIAETRTAAEADVVTTTLELVGASSVSPHAGPAATVLARILGAHGFTVTVDEWGNTMGHLDFGPGPTVLFDAHVDTVEVGDPSRWTHDPAGELVGDRLVGRGVVDTKGPLAAAITAAGALAGSPGRGGRLVISGSVDEELAEGPSLGRILDQVTPDVVVIGEPSANLLRIGQRGRAEVEVEIIGTASHSAFPEAGINAVEVMAEAIIALRELPLRADPHFGAGLLTLVSIRSEPYPSQSTVPSRCVAVFDRRTVVGESDTSILDEIRAVVAPVAHAHGAGADVRLARARWQTWRGHDVDVPVYAPAWYQDPRQWPVADVLAALRRDDPGARTGTWQFCTHGSESAGRRGIPTIGFGPGDPGQAHTADESMSLAELRAGVDGYYAIFGALLAAR